MMRDINETPPKATVPSLPPKPCKVLLEIIRIIPVKRPAKKMKVYPLAITGAVIPANAPQYIAAGNSLKVSDLLLINGIKELKSPVIPAESTIPKSSSRFSQ